MLELDINKDGQKDLIVWQLYPGFETKTEVYVFLRGADGKLPERPTQTLHCRGFPIPIGTVREQTPLADINGYRVCELVLLEPKTTMISPNSLLEAAGTACCNEPGSAAGVAASADCSNACGSWTSSLCGKSPDAHRATCDS